MHSLNLQLSTRRALIIALACIASPAISRSSDAYTFVTKSFQAGVNGITESDIQFTSNYANAPTTGNNKGATGTQLFVDGYNGTDSPDQQVFLKYTNLFGTGANQIPMGAFIINASLTLTTGTSTAGQSGGPFGVGGVLVNWNSNSTYNNLKPAGSSDDGLNFANGMVTRSVGFYDDPAPLYGGTNSLETAATSADKGTNYYRYTANVAQVVQAWSNGVYPNYGFNIQAGAPRATTDGWQVKTATNGTVADRPLLNVSYTTAPVQTAKFQEGVNSYNGTTMSWVRLENDSATDGASLDKAFLDGYQFNYDEDDISSDDHALIKFSKLFQSEGGTIPNNALILKATLGLTTSTVSNAQTGQPYQAHQMLRDWGTSTTWTDFDSYYGIRTGVDESQMLSAQYGMIPDGQAQFDITQAVQNWASGQNNYGIDIRATPPSTLWTGTDGTSDGWSIYFNGAADTSVRPELTINYVLRVNGDANDSGRVDADDYVAIDRGYLMHLTGWNNGDFDGNGMINSSDYLIIDTAYAQQHGYDPMLLAMREAQFGQGYVSSLLAAVPEPSALAIFGAVLPGLIRRRRGSLR